VVGKSSIIGNTGAFFCVDLNYGDESNYDDVSRPARTSRDSGVGIKRDHDDSIQSPVDFLQNDFLKPTVKVFFEMIRNLKYL
jgi:hypothetical protein